MKVENDNVMLKGRRADLIPNYDRIQVESLNSFLRIKF